MLGIASGRLGEAGEGFGNAWGMVGRLGEAFPQMPSSSKRLGGGLGEAWGRLGEAFPQGGFSSVS